MFSHGTIPVFLLSNGRIMEATTYITPSHIVMKGLVQRKLSTGTTSPLQLLGDKAR
jgi:hypothetical protein